MLLQAIFGYFDVARNVLLRLEQLSILGIALPKDQSSHRLYNGLYVVALYFGIVNSSFILANHQTLMCLYS